MTDLDFLDASGQDFSSESDLFSYIDEEEVLDDIGSNVNLIGSINNYSSRTDFFSSISGNFERIWEEDEQSLDLLAAHTGGRAIPYYVFYDEDFPVFITTANISDEMPETIEKFLLSDPHLGRFWISMRQMDRMRGRLVRQDPDVKIPFFTGHRSAYSDVPADKRENVKRTVSYWASDGRMTYKEMRKKYGILPTNLRFERPSDYKFGLKQEGILSHQSGSISKAWELLSTEKERKKVLKEIINTGGKGTSDSDLFPGEKVTESRPWAIKMGETGVQPEALNTFRNRMAEDRWQFGLSEYRNDGEHRFNAEVVDDNRYGRTEIEGQNDTIRVYPIDGNDIDPQFRLFNFVQDHFDPNLNPEVV